MSDIGQAHVICCNDSVEGVFFGNAEGASDYRDHLAKCYYDSRQLKWEYPLYGDYLKRFYWHIHTVQAVAPLEMMGRVLADAMHGYNSLTTPDHMVGMAVWLKEVRGG